MSEQIHSFGIGLYKITILCMEREYISSIVPYFNKKRRLSDFPFPSFQRVQLPH